MVLKKISFGRQVVLNHFRFLEKFKMSVFLSNTAFFYCIKLYLRKYRALKARGC